MMENLTEIQAFCDDAPDDLRCARGFEYVRNLKGIEVLVECTNKRVRQRVKSNLAELYYNRNSDVYNVVIGNTISPLIYGLQAGFDPDVLCDLSADVLDAVKKLKLTPDCSLQELVVAFSGNVDTIHRYARYGKFPETVYNGTFGDVYKVHSYLFSKKILPDWWDSDFRLYTKVLELSRVWDFPFYVENLQFLTREDAEIVVQQNHHVNLFAFLWAKDIQDLLKKNGCDAAARKVHDIVFKTQHEQWFAIYAGDVCLPVTFHNYYQLRHAVIAELRNVMPYSALVGNAPCGIVVNLLVSACTFNIATTNWYCPEFKPDFSGDAFPVKTYVYNVCRIIGCMDKAEKFSDFQIVTRVFPSISDVFRQYNDAPGNQLAEKLQEIINQQ